MLTRERFEQELAGRQTPEVRERLREGTVAVAGLGGLGSNIALMLARTGISKLFLADFDRVDPSNLNRQAYTISQIGMKKTEAMSELIRQVNPWIELEFFDGRVTQENAAELFRTYPIICEAFDSPEAKADLVNSILSQLPGNTVISGSGMAGAYSSNQIKNGKENETALCVRRRDTRDIRRRIPDRGQSIHLCGTCGEYGVRLILGEEEV